MDIIPTTKRMPGSYVTVDESGANTGLPAYRQRLQIVAPRIKTPAAWETGKVTAVGEMVKPTAFAAHPHYYICIVGGTSGSTEPAWPGAGGTVTDGSTLKWREVCNGEKIIAVNTPTRIFSADDAAEKSGSGSVAHRMVMAAFKQYRDCEVYLNLVDDAETGVMATATIIIAGTAVGAGSCQVPIGNKIVTLAWESGDTSAEIATALDAEIAKHNALPVTPSVAASTVTLRAKNAGELGNELGRYSVSGANYQPVIKIVGSGITATVTAWVNGVNNPDITDALDAAAPGEYELLATPYRDTTNLAAIAAYMSSEGDYVNCQGVRAFLGITSTIAAATTLAAENNPRLHLSLVRQAIYSSFEIAASFAAMHAQAGHPGLPINGMEMIDCDAPEISARLEPAEIESLLWVGVTPFNADTSGAVRCVRSVTTYQTNASGTPDPFYLDTTTIACLDYTRKVIKAGHQLHFSRSILRENHVDGEPEFIVTPSDIASYNFTKCKEIERYGALQNVDAYKDRFITVRNPDVAGRADSDIPAEVVQGLHILANTIRIVS